MDQSVCNPPNQPITQSSTANTSGFLTALWLNGAIFVAELIVFTAVRGRFKSIYEPRTFIPPENKRMNPLPQPILSWPWAVYKADWKQVLHQNGMDAYVFLRYLRMMLKIFIPIWAVSWAVLLPTTSVKAACHKSGLDMFTFGNIGTGKNSVDQRSRYAAHVILSWFFTAYILYVLQKEMRTFIRERQQFLTSSNHAASAQANTVLITGVPLRYLSVSALTKLFEYMPGGVAKVWINRDLKNLPDLYDQRLKACNKLESAELSLIKMAAKIRKKQIKKGERTEREAGQVEANELSKADELVPRRRDRPIDLSQDFCPLVYPLWVKKVDTVDWAKEEIIRTTQELLEGRTALENEDLLKFSEGETAKDSLTYPPVNSAFVLFHNQISAHLAAQALTHHAPYRMAGKYTEMAPADVIWGNLGMNPYEIRVRQAISYCATAALIIFWAIPVAAVGIISSAVSAGNFAPLNWLNSLGDTVKGLIQGILPAVLLAILNILLPIILRLLARFEGIPRKTGLELSLMTRFFIFQVVHNFLIITIAATITQTIKMLIDSPSSIPTLLAQGLPPGSTFFMTYIILQGLTGSAAGFLQIVPLAVYYAKLFILGSTPRSIYAIKYDLRDVAWGTLFPSITLITVIAIAYMVISPIITGMAMAAFFLFYMMWKYLFLWQLDQPASGDTGGLFFPKAIQHTIIALYLQQVVLAALLFLAKAIGQGIAIVVLIFVTAFCHLVMNNSFAPLIHPLPLTYARRSHVSSLGEDSSDDEFVRNDNNANKERKVSMGSDGKKPIVEDGPGPSVAVEGKRNEGPTDFTHPAAVEPQRIVWIPDDELGIGRSEVSDLEARGIEASTENATFTSKGHTEISGHPPGMVLE